MIFSFPLYRTKVKCWFFTYNCALTKYLYNNYKGIFKLILFFWHLIVLISSGDTAGFSLSSISFLRWLWFVLLELNMWLICFRGNSYMGNSYVGQLIPGQLIPGATHTQYIIFFKFSNFGIWNIPDTITHLKSTDKMNINYLLNGFHIKHN